MTIKMRYSPEIDNQTWPITCDGEFVTTVKNYLIDDGIPNDGADDIVNNAAKVLRYCPNPYTNENVNHTGIVIGKVQSGKTSSFISLIGLAFDNSYDIVIVLGGTKDILVSQNKTRIEEYFHEKSQYINVLDTKNDKELLNSNQIINFIKRGKKIIIVALKGTSQINYLSENVFKNSSLADKPILVIDDEGDEASLNGKVYSKSMSATYKTIIGLKDALHRHAFISVTATPQANMLIDTIDTLSPDFGVLVYPGRGYCGLNTFHNDKTYIKEIPDKEDSILDGNVPQSLIEALSMFFVACAVQQKRGLEDNQKVSMMIHPSRKIKDQRSVFKKIESIVSEWRESAKDKSDISYNDLKKIIYCAYEEYKNTTVNDIYEFEILEDSILETINNCHIHMVNGEGVPDGKDKYFDFNIYVGGDMLGRGLTIKGLTITYIIRTAKGDSSVDTVQQRARWFGYKTKYLDLCRIFAVKKIIREFNDIRDHEEDLWSTIEHADLDGVNFKNITRIFKLNNGLRMTRRNVARTESYAFSFWNKQKIFLYDSEATKSNINILNNFKNKYSDKLLNRIIGEGAPYRIIEEVKFSTVKKELIDNYIFPIDSKLNLNVISKLNSILDDNHLDPKVDVIWMRDGETSKHDVVDGLIGNYSVGRRPLDKSVKPLYKGDDYEFKKIDVMQLQIHMIEDKATKKISPVLALYLPDAVVSKITNLVIQSN